MITIAHAHASQDVDVVRALFQEYAAALGVDLCFQGFADELASLPALYAPPKGRLLLARSGDDAAGCVALRPKDRICEMKRLFVRPAFRGQGLGRLLAERVIVEARVIGYSSIVLDTLDSMTGAIQLYESLGFVRRSAYYATPLENTVFMELKL